MNDSNEIFPLTERLRVVQLLDLDPGIQGKGAAAKQIVMLRLGHGGEIEQPMAISLWDARRLTTLLIQALDHHGDPFGESLHDLATQAGQWRPSWFEDSDPDAQLRNTASAPSGIPRGDAMTAERPIFAKRKLTEQQPTKVRINICFGTGRPIRRAYLHGGYTDGSISILLYRVRAAAGIHDGLLWVSTTDKWLGEMEIADDACVPLYHWPQFFLIPEGNRLVLGDGTRWIKMTSVEVSRFHGRRLKPAITRKDR